MSEAGLDEWQSWRCSNDATKFCPPEGCPKDYGCARMKGWQTGEPSPRECQELKPLQPMRFTDGTPVFARVNGLEI
jgi:hypothetical protein